MAGRTANPVDDAIGVDLRALTPAELLVEIERLNIVIDAMRIRIVDLERLADTDTLTPLPNRRVFVREVERVAHQVTRYGTPAAVMFVDLDGLKTLNDVHGHHAGDAALIHIAKLLKREVRVTDIVARIGGDEFGLLLDHLDEDAAAAKAAALANALSQHPLVIDDKTIALRLSIGVATMTGHDDVAAILARADARMYAVKLAQRSER